MGVALALVALFCACGRVNFDPIDAFVVPRVDDRTVAAGRRYTCALVAGTPWCWGNNTFGQLANGATGGVDNIPKAVQGVTDAISIRAANDCSDTDGAFHACVLHADATASCWGRNEHGQLGDNSLVTRGIVQPVLGLTDIVEIDPGSFHTCALRRDGTVWCWGGNPDGQRGNGDIGVDVLVPQPVPGLARVIDIDAGWWHTCALRDDGHVLCWGNNTDGELGLPFGQNSAVPIEVVGIADVVEIAAGNESTCARLPSGQVYCWGGNPFGALGDGTTMDRYTPAPVLGLNDATSIISGHGPACSVRASGTIACWGFGNIGDLGNGFTNNVTMPTAVSSITDALEVTIGFHHGCSRRATGQLMCWGQNDQGQVGNQSTLDQLTPVAVNGLP